MCDAEPLRFGAPPLCRRTLILRAASQWPKKPYGEPEREVEQRFISVSCAESTEKIGVDRRRSKKDKDALQI